MEWRSATKQRMLELGLTHERLAEQLGVTPGAISHWLSGRRVPPLETINRVLQAVGLEKLSLRFENPDQSDDGALPPSAITMNRKTGAGASRSNEISKRTYPLMSWEEAGTQNPVGHHLIESDEDAGENGYWLEVFDDSMTAITGISFSVGMRILVRPEDFTLVSGKFYLAKDNAGGTIFAQYVRASGAEYLRPLNPAYKAMELTSSAQIIGRIIDAKMARSIF